MAWDDECLLPFPDLDRLLIDLHCHAPEKAWSEMDRLLRNVPSQRAAVQRAWTTLDIRAAAKAQLAILDQALSALPEGKMGFLTQTADVKAAAAAIAADAREVATRTRPLFRALAAERLVNRIIAFQGTVTGYHEPLASELRVASVQWLAQAESLAREAGVAAEQAGIRQYFRAGDPVDREGEAFVARAPVLAELERQVLLAAGCPGLLLYGRRRVGKSTVLKGLEGLIPGEVLPLYVSLQNPQAGGDVAHFCGYLRQRIAERLGLDVPAEERSDLPALMATLARADAALATGDRRLLLALDEYETIDQRVAEGLFPPDILAALRESIQTHRRIVWLFAGSHHIDELPHADWASHLISVRSVPVPMFTAAETRALLTNPLAHSPAFRVDDPRRPRIAEAFWGEDGIAWLHATAGGWPHLVQLLAEGVVDEVNDREAKAFESAWRGDVLDRAAGRGEMVLRQLLLGESRLEGEAAYLLGFADVEVQPPPADRAVARSLHRRELVTVTDDGWRLRVPLMRHWLVMNRHLL
ncbi:hypothetical protein HL658_23405 [Azospirillum sp. RWY-5-1]|uniref:ATP-binding protein n=1 Tax=Azospirillum oleiclasticum TaxID=2735135 RepID=A0ABX2TIP5_9PROT|nr:hypothetical protein [Azospirillum oleiclasticum]NYZ15497.1 hypothetical protein [Azospirillum oleiclasticum]NYZ22520.1 hypothetical protein [Azospirillum oleiclasticum]